MCAYAHVCLLNFIKLPGASLLLLSLSDSIESVKRLCQLGDIFKSVLVGTHFYLNLTCICTLICSTLWPVIGLGVVLANVFVVSLLLLLSYICVSMILVFYGEDC